MRATTTWGVRFAEPREAVEFVEKLAHEVADRMRRLKVRGRTLTLKVLRAVENAPDHLMKGSVGHGVCDHMTRAVGGTGADIYFFFFLVGAYGKALTQEVRRKGGR